MTQGGNIGKVTVIGLFDAELSGYIFDLRWVLALLAALIFADYWWGVREARHKGEDVRLSRAWRRTLNKFIDYVTYVVVGAMLSHAILTPLGYTSGIQAGIALGLGLGIICEADSVVKHNFAVRGIRFSWKKLLISVIKMKSPDWGKAVDEAMETRDN